MNTPPVQQTYAQQDLLDALRSHLNPTQATQDPRSSGGMTWPDLPPLALAALVRRWHTLRTEHRDQVAAGAIPPPPHDLRMPWYTAKAILTAELGTPTAQRIDLLGDVLRISENATDVYLSTLLHLARQDLTADIAADARRAAYTTMTMRDFVTVFGADALGLVARAGWTPDEVEDAIATRTLPSREELATLAALRTGP